MTTRTFKQYGQAYGSVPASITATIDGTVVFSGPISTLDTPFPSLPGNIITPEIFTWTNSLDFTGTQSFSIAVTGSPLLLSGTLADHCIANNATEFGVVFSFDDDGVMVADPFTNVAIDGVAKQRGPDNTAFPGQWQWLIPAGSTLTAVLNINPPVLSYIQFDSIPSTIQPGQSGTFVMNIPSVNPDEPLPVTYGWRIVNGTTTNADFQAVSGSVTFNTPTASFNITTVAHDPPQFGKTFTIEIYGLTQGKLLSTSDIVTIT
jgi:hypothetical protein